MNIGRKFYQCFVLVAGVVGAVAQVFAVTIVSPDGQVVADVSAAGGR